MTGRTCLACHGRPVTDTFICQPCGDEYHGLLPRITPLVEDLDIEITRQSRKGGTTGGGRVRTFERPLEYNQAASEALEQLRSVLAATCQALTPRQVPPSSTCAGMADWIMTHEAAVPLHPHAGNMITGLADATKQGQAIIDNPPERVMIGQCDCGTDMHTPRDATVHRCTNQACQAEWDVPAVLAWRDELAQDQLLPLNDIAAIARIPKGTLKSWVSRGRLMHHGSDRDGVRLYRYGAALALRAG